MVSDSGDSDLANRGWASSPIEAAAPFETRDLEAEEPVVPAPLLLRLERARARWPSIRLSAEAFVAQRGHLLTGASASSGGEDLEVEDLYLAWAAAQQDPAALLALDALLVVPGQVRQMGAGPAFADEVRQAVRGKLVMGQPGTPRLLEYSGRGPLARWLRVVLLRTAISLGRGQAQRQEPDTLEDLVDQPDPELDYVKLRARAQLQHALDQALAALDARSRNLLRLHHLDQVTLDQLARLHRVHRATVARWLSEAREHLLSQTRAWLHQQLRLSAQECDSLIRLGLSRLDLRLEPSLAAST